MVLSKIGVYCSFLVACFGHDLQNEVVAFNGEPSQEKVHANNIPIQTGKFVIFVSQNESLKKKDNYAGAWELITDKTAPFVVKRCEFEKSIHAPRLLYPLPGFENIVLINVSKKRGACQEFDIIFKVDYHNWQVTKLLESERIGCFGGSGNLMYLMTDQKPRLLDCRTGDVRPPSDKPLEVLYSFEDKWLIKYLNDNSNTIYLFNPGNGSTVAKVVLPDNFTPAYSYSIISDDNRILALIQEVDLDDVGTLKPPKFKEAKVALFDLKHNIHHYYNTYGWAWAGFGAIAYDPMIRITPDNQFQYVTLSREAERKDSVSIEDNHFELVTVDPNTLNAKIEPFDLKFSKTPEYSEIAHEPRVPGYLNVEKMVGHLDHRIAHAFLKYKGLDYEVPVAILDTTVAFSSDGRYFLLKMNSGTEADDFFYGDLERQILHRVKFPTKSLQWAQVNIYWVPVQGSG